VTDATRFIKHVPKDPAENLRWRVRMRRAAIGSIAVRETLYDAAMSDVLFFFNAFLWVYEPRDAVKLKPFVTWPHQGPVIVAMDQAINEAQETREPLAFTLKKSRAQGGTYAYLGVDIRRAIREPGFSVGLVTRNERLVDSATDSDTIMYKLAWMLDRLPFWMLPGGYQRSLSTHTIALPNGSLFTGYAATGDVGRGGRKAQPLDAKILTPDGWRVMGDLKVGHFVIGQNGLSVKVRGVFPLGEKQVFRVTFSDGSFTECCDDHLWKVATKSSWEVKNLYDIRKNYLISDKRGFKKKRYRIPLVAPVEFPERKLLLDPYLVGCLLGDGGLSGTGTPNYTTADVEIIELLSARLPSGCFFTKGKADEYGYRIVTKNGSGGASANPVRAALDTLGMSGKVAHQKSIPDDYKFGSIEDRLECLRGLMDSDGWVHKRGIGCKAAFCSTSRQLVEDAAFIVRSLGGLTGNILVKHPENGRTAYEIVLAMPKGTNPFRLKRKATNYTGRTKYPPVRYVASIEPVGVKPVQCIWVDGAMYVTDDCIVTHNTKFDFDEPGSEEFISGGKDYKVMSSVSSVSNCTFLVSTFGADTGVFYEAATDSDNRRLYTLDWKDNPTQNRGAYIRRESITAAVRPEEQGIVNEYVKKQAARLDKLERRGHVLEGKFRSPWYDAYCMLPGATPRFVARELDMDPRGAVGKVFDPDVLDRMASDYCRPPVFQGNLVFDPQTLEFKGLVQQQNGPLKLWFRPGVDSAVPMGFYVIGCDIAVGAKGDYSSNSAACGINRTTGEQVAEYAIMGMPSVKFARVAVVLARWLRNAYLGWEDSGMASPFASEIINTIGYGDIYYREVTEFGSHAKTRNPGWWNKGDEAKANLFENMCLEMEEEQFLPRSDELIGECREYEWHKGKIIHRPTQQVGVAGKAHGDRCIAAGVARLLCRDRPQKQLDSQTAAEQNAPYGTLAWRMREDRERKAKLLDEQGEVTLANVLNS